MHVSTEIRTAAVIHAASEVGGNRRECTHDVSYASCKQRRKGVSTSMVVWVQYPLRRGALSRKRSVMESTSSVGSWHTFNVSCPIPRRTEIICQAGGALGLVN